MKIKICGLKYLDNLVEVLNLKPDFIGFIFYPKSPRYFDQITPEELIQVNFGQTKKVGVFVDESPSKILKLAKDYHLDYVQLHGLETPQCCTDILKHGIGVIKSFSIAEPQDLLPIQLYEDQIDFILLDTKTPFHGGSGVKFDWSFLNNTTFNKPLIVGGGVGPNDVEALKGIQTPIYSVDVNSQFELKPGLKNINLLQEFIHKIQVI